MVNAARSRLYTLAGLAIGVAIVVVVYLTGMRAVGSIVLFALGIGWLVWALWTGMRWRDEYSRSAHVMAGKLLLALSLIFYGLWLLPSVNADRRAVFQGLGILCTLGSVLTIRIIPRWRGR